jgi:ABC-type oligopeptide transport system substrate-binding subunit
MRVLALALFLLTGCRGDGRYLGNTKPPDGQKLVYANTHEPFSLDPAMQTVQTESNIQQCLFEGLAVSNPVTSQPMAGMATHYEVSADGKVYTFYLRGHSHPQGIRLADIGALPPEFSHRAQAPADSVPARRSDGAPVTAADFVYSWRRLVDPHVASPNASDVAIILNARDIVAGKQAPDHLGAEALDDFTLRVHLESPAPYFVGLATQADLMPVPRHVVERARLTGHVDQWARPGRIVGNGPFSLAEWRPYESLRVVKSQTYYERDLVKLNEITFIPTDSTAVINLYRAGRVHSLYQDSLPPSLIPALKSKADFRSDRQLALLFVSINTHEPPLDNQMLRWAVNMAIDKRAIAEFWSSKPARRLIPSVPGYTSPQSLVVEVRGKKYDIMAYDPAGARELLASAGYPGGFDASGKRLAFPITIWSQRAEMAEMIRYQLVNNLNIEVRVNVMEASVLAAAQYNGAVEGISIWVWDLGYIDPYNLLGPMFTDFLGWHDSGYAAEVEEASRQLDPRTRLQRLALCETRLMQSMPLIPLFFMPDFYLVKPYVRGLVTDLLGDVSFRYAFIDSKFQERVQP